MDDKQYMTRALELAREAFDDGETPVGAVIVRGDGFIAGRGRNRREKGRNALYHAETEAIDNACRTLGGWRLSGCTMYVTLEPCVMCSGAAINSRLDRVVFGAYDSSDGCSLTRLAEAGYFPRGKIEAGVMERECQQLLNEFFARIRSEKKMSKIILTKVETDAQIEAAAALADEIWHEWFPSILTAEQIDYMVEKFQSFEAMKNQIAKQSYTYYILRKGSERIGYTAICPDGEGGLFLSKIYIKKEHRGNGYSKEVFEFLKNYCKEHGFDNINLTVNKHNDNSIAVYKKCGFYLSGEGVSEIGGGFVMDDYYFRLDIEKES